MLMSEKLCLTNDGHFHEHKFEGALENLRPLLPKFLQSTVQRILHKDEVTRRPTFGGTVPIFNNLSHVQRRFKKVPIFGKNSRRQMVHN